MNEHVPGSSLDASEGLPPVSLDAGASAPLVSVIVPARNAAATLGETLDSLLAQEEPRWEAIVVDDGSSDDTAKVAQAYIDRDPRFQLVPSTGVGVSGARNRGLEKARGRWLLFLDSDDWISPRHMSKLLAALEAEPDKQAAFGAYQRVAPDGGLQDVRWDERMLTDPFQLMARQCGIAIHSILIDRELVMEVGGFDTGLKAAEDWDLWQRVTRAGLRFAGIDEVVAYYRMSPSSLSRDMSIMGKDAVAVMKRGFSEDPRVRRPAPEYAQGASGDPDYETCFSFMAMWWASTEIGEGRSGAAFLSTYDEVGDLKDHPHGVADTIVRAVAVGARMTHAELAENWARFEPAVLEMLEIFQAASSRPGFITATRYSIARNLADRRESTSRLQIGPLLVQPVDLARLEPLTAPAGVDLVRLHFRFGSDVLWPIETPYFGEISTAELAALAIDRLKATEYRGRKGRVKRIASWLAAAAAAAPSTAGKVAELMRERGGFKPGVRTVLKDAVRAKALESANAEGVRRLTRTQARPVLDLKPRWETSEVEGPNGEVDPSDRTAMWEGAFETEDPWSYGSAYEQVKYERTLGLLRDEPIGSALELCCAEGWFTTKLAPRVGRLIASDISSLALKRAAARCREASNIEFRQIDICEDEFPGDQHLVVCSEALYYVGSERLRATAEKIAAAVKPGGLFLHAHAHTLSDEPDRTGFDWGTAFGVATIHRAFAEIPGMRLERSIETDLYRIDLFRRTDEARTSPPELQVMDLACELEPDVADAVVWGGRKASRVAPAGTGETNLVPVLMYHSVSDHGPEGLRQWRQSLKQFSDQVKWLKDNGYHPITSVDVVEYFNARRPFPGKPVLISFDDGFVDFHANAWPILKDAGFSAEVFIVTDLVGQAAVWDDEYGEPAPLMNWAEIRELSAQGAAFGSHMASHTSAAALTSAELALEAARSKAALQEALGREVCSIAAPFGVIDERFLYVTKVCGYEVGYSTEWGLAHRGLNRLRLPRIEVYGQWDLDTFAATMEHLNAVR